MVAHAKRIFEQVWGDFALTKHAHKWADNLKKCSCHVCQPGSSGRQVKRADERTKWELKRLKENYHAQI
jgi:hypothetical protein